MSEALAPTIARLWRRRDIADYANVSLSTVHNWERKGLLPRGRRVTPRAVRWDPREVEAALSTAGLATVG